VIQITSGPKGDSLLMRRFAASLKTSQRNFCAQWGIPLARATLCLEVIAHLLFLTGCSNTADQQLFADKCANSNLNCKDASLLLATTGAKIDLSPEAVAPGSDVDSVPVKPIRYNDTTSVSFLIQNTSLLPLRSFSLGRSVATGFTIESAGDDDCAIKSVLLYNQTCRVTISFTPGVVAPDVDLTFNFKTLLGGAVVFTSGVFGAKITADFSLTGSTNFTSELVHDPSDNNYFSSDLTIANHGNIETLKSISFTLSGPDASQFAIAPPGGGSDCTSGQDLLPNGQACVIHIRYLPLNPGYHHAELNLATTSGQLRSFTLSGRGIAVSAQSSALSFGSHLTSSAPADLPLTISNPNTNGNPTASTCTYTLAGSSQYSIQANTCVGTVSAGTSCTITLRYTPSAAVSWHGGFLNVTCNARGGSLSVPLSAESVTSPLRADVSGIEFGEVASGGNQSATVTLSNVGGSTLTNLSPLLTSLSGGSSVTITSTTCASNLAASSSCAITLLFSPTALDARSAVLAASSDGGSLENAVTLHGSAVALQANRGVVDFGSVVVNEDRMGGQVVFVNPSNSLSFTGCSFDSSSLSAQGFTLDSASTCQSVTELQPGASCVLHSRFTATGAIGARAATAQFSCMIGGSQTVMFKGQVASDLSLVVFPPTFIDFSGRLVGVTSLSDFTFANQHGSLAVAGLAITAPGIISPWSLVNLGVTDCSVFNSFTAGQSCSLRLQYQPSAAYGSEQTGTTSGTINITSTSVGATPTAPTYSGTAVKITPSSSSINFGDVLVGSDSSIRYISIENPSPLDNASGCTANITAPFSIVSTTCNTTLSKRNSCVIGLRLPTQAAPSAASGIFTMSCPLGGRASVALTARVYRIPTLVWTGTTDFGFVDLGATTTPLTLTLNHTGVVVDDATTALALFMLASSSSAFTLNSHNCPAVLSPGASCTATVGFAPLVAGALTATLRAGDPAVNSDLALSGYGVDTSLRLVPSPTSLSLAGRLIGRTIDTDVTVTNSAASGTATGVSVGSPSSGAPWSLAVSGSPCGATLPVTNSCDIRLRYQPTSVGTSSGTVSLTATNMNPAKTISYTGSATKISSSTTSLNFGQVDSGSGASADVTHANVVTISNPSTIDDATGCVFTVDSPFAKFASTCDTGAIAKNSSCSYQIKLPFQSSPSALTGNATVTCTVGGSASVALSAEVIPAPNLQIKDTINNLSFANSITTTNITGAQYSATNIVYPPGGTASVTYTIKSSVASSATLNSLSLTLTPGGGVGNTMSLANNTCTGVNLASGSTCTFDVVYQPTAASDVSTFSLTVAGTSEITGNSFSTGATSVTGYSITPASLSIDSTPISIGQFFTVNGATTGTSGTYTITNTGEQTATGLSFNIVAPDFGASDHTLFTQLTSNTDDCGYGGDSDLGRNEVCKIRVQLAPVGAVGIFRAKLAVTGTQSGATLNVPIKAATYGNSVLTTQISNQCFIDNGVLDCDGMEADLTGDSDRIYIVSRSMTSASTYNPILTLCSKTSKGLPDTANCTQNNLITILSLAGVTNLAGSVAGSGPRITLIAQKIIMSLENDDAGAGGSTNGTRTVVICQKPAAASNTVSDCTNFVVDAGDSSGLFPSLAASATYLVLANSTGLAGSAKTLVVASCPIDSTAATSAATLNSGNCKKTTVGLANQGSYPSITLTASTAIVATYDTTAANPALRLTACSISASDPVCTSSLEATSPYIDGVNGNLYPGMYPAITFSGTKIYTVHQTSDQYMRLQLTSCSLSGTTISACETQTVENASGKGNTPRIAASSTGLWISSVHLSTPSMMSSQAKLSTYYCAFPITSTSCTSVTGYGSQPAVKGNGPMYSRSAYFDPISNVLILPYQEVGVTYNARNGFFSLGLLPEL
jgi:hypothetical protein